MIEFIINIIIGSVILNLILILLDYIVELYWFKYLWDEPFTLKEYFKTWKNY